MFFSIFSTLVALIGAYNQSSSLNQDFKHMVLVQEDNSFTTESVVGSISDYDSYYTSVEFRPSMLQIIHNNDNYNVCRYYISANPSANSYLAYVDFYCDYIPATQDHLVTYYLPTCKIYVSENFNFKLSFTWSFYNSDFPSVPLDYSLNLDFSQETTRIVYLQVERSELLSSTYYSSLSNSILLVGSPMNQDEFNAVTNASESGYDSGYSDGYDDGNYAGYQTGYTAGYQEGASQDATAVVIFTGIINVALLPVNMFLQMLNFEVFGINIGGLVSAFLTIAIVVIIIRIVTGKKASD